MPSQAFLTLVLLFTGASAASAAESRTAQLDPPVVRAVVTEIAAVVRHEYMDAAAADRIAAALLRRLDEGQYAGVTTPEALADLVTRHLGVESRDKHLSVAVRELTTPSRGARDLGREDAARRSNGGVQRVEILPGNVGYLNLTAFWRLAEAQDAIGDAMRLLRRADALIVDMRHNGGGSPETVAFLIGYLFDDAPLPLFEIVSRNGNRMAYATPATGPRERDARRPVFVLTASRTFSAGEGFAFLLQERRRAEVIGERTAGAANPGRPYRVSSVFEVTVPNGQVRSAFSGRNWEGVGVSPDVSVFAFDALHAAHTRALRVLLKDAPEGPWRDTLERELEKLQR